MSDDEIEEGDPEYFDCVIDARMGKRLKLKSRWQLLSINPTKNSWQRKLYFQRYKK